MGDFYIGEIRAFTFNYVPNNWTACNGQTLTIQSNQALYAIIGTTYGGDGKVNFKLPNLNGAFVYGAGVDASTMVNHPVGETTTHPKVNLAVNQLPAHVHSSTFTPTSGQMTFSVNGADVYGGVKSPNGNILARSGVNASASASTYTTAATADAQLNGVTATGGSFGGGMVVLDPVGGGDVPIMPPYVAITYAIATKGIFPPRA